MPIVGNRTVILHLYCTSSRLHPCFTRSQQRQRGQAHLRNGAVPRQEHLLAARQGTRHRPGRDIDLPLDDETLSRRHCVVTYEDDRIYVDDLHSVNGTFVNGARIAGKTELLEFDRLFFGSTEMELRGE